MRDHTENVPSRVGLAQTPFLSSYHFALGPGAAVIALGVVLLACRWVFSTSHRERRAASARAQGDFGLLVPVASPADLAAAELARRLLAGHGVRATVAETRPPPGPVRVTADGHVLPRQEELPVVRLLVFPADLERARTLLAGG